MKKKIQKYLSGEREGFSLIELIIVIAIMAILIGVIALAVIPNINKSKVSKDLATLDSVCSALNSAVATTQAKGNATFKFTTTKVASPADEKDKVINATIDALGSGSSTLTSNNAHDIYCEYNVSTKKIRVFSSSDGTTVDEADDENKTKLEVTN